jgi:CTP:molybdopterin cytidylyltransferase MocA
VRVLGVVAAAGASGRMGSPKALLSTRVFDTDGVDEPWVRRVARMMRDGGVTDVVVTVPDDIAVARAIADAVVDIARTTTNPQPQLGLSGSLFAALDVVAADAVLLCPVDAPGLEAGMCQRLIAAIGAGADGGPRAVLATVVVAEVAVDDDRALWDLNSPADLARLRG